MHRCYQSQSQFLPKVKLRTINQLEISCRPLPAVDPAIQLGGIGTPMHIEHSRSPWHGCRANSVHGGLYCTTYTSFTCTQNSKQLLPPYTARKQKQARALSCTTTPRSDAVIAIDLAARDARFSISRRQQTAASVAKPHRRGSSLHRYCQSQSQFLPKVKLRTINQLEISCRPRP